MKALFAAVHGSAPGRYCCKSPKLPGPKFLAVKKTDLRPPIDVAPIALPRSPASLSSGNEVPHIFTRKSRLRPKEFLISSAKRLLQQNLPGTDIPTNSIAARQHCQAEMISLVRSTRRRAYGLEVNGCRLRVSQNSFNGNVPACAAEFGCGLSLARWPRIDAASSCGVRHSASRIKSVP
jgi:hypothetical protein